MLAAVDQGRGAQHNASEAKLGPFEIYVSDDGQNWGDAVAGDHESKGYDDLLS